MSTNVTADIRKLSQNRYRRHTIDVVFKNGKKNRVFAFPRNYVNLANKYMNVKQAPYRIAKNSINWPRVRDSTAKNMAQNTDWVVMHPFWVDWINKNFKNMPSGGGTWTKLAPGIGSFIAKSKKEQQAPSVRYVNGKYVKVPTMRNRAATAVALVQGRKQRLAKIKESLKHAVEYERARKRYAGTHRFRYESANNFGV
jgi:hypothetical protein